MAIFNAPIARVADDNYKVGSGYKFYFYAAGTTTLKDTYTSNTYATALSNPVVADGNGRFVVIWTSGNYKVKLTDASDVEVWTADNYDNDAASATFAEGVLSAAGSAANVITANLPTAPSALADQQQVVVELQHGANTITNPTFNLNGLGAQTIVRDDDKPLRAGDTGGDGAKNYLSYSTTKTSWELLNPAQPSKGLEPDWISGLAITNNSGTPLTKLDIAAGERISSTGGGVLSLASGLVKSPFVTFAEGDDAGAFSDAGTGATPSTGTWYKVYIITKVTGESDICVSDTQANALLDDIGAAAGYVYANRIGYVYSNGSTQIIPHVLDNKRGYTWSVTQNSLTTTAISTSRAAVVTAVPPSQTGTYLFLHQQTDTAGSTLIFTQTDQADSPPSGAQISLANEGDGINVSFAQVVMELKADSSSQIQYRGTTGVANDQLIINTLSYIDDLGVA